VFVAGIEPADHFVGRGGAALSKGFSVAGTALKAGVGGALAGEAVALGVGVNAINAVASLLKNAVNRIGDLVHLQ